MPHRKVRLTGWVLGRKTGLVGVCRVAPEFLCYLFCCLEPFEAKDFL